MIDHCTTMGTYVTRQPCVSLVLSHVDATFELLLFSSSSTDIHTKQGLGNVFYDRRGVKASLEAASILFGTCDQR